MLGGLGDNVGYEGRKEESPPGAGMGIKSFFSGPVVFVAGCHPEEKVIDALIIPSGGTQTEDDTGRPLHILTGRCRWHQGAVKNIRT